MRSQKPSRPLFRVGEWLFRRRTALPIPLAVALLFIPPDPSSAPSLVAVGAVVVALAESLRLWAVHHIGAISRTRSDRLGPVISTGPFALVRNPLYLGNIALWIGFAISARILWLAPIFAVVLAFEYSAIVRWEERLLAARRGEEYRDYMRNVPRWAPRVFSRRSSVASLSRQAPVAVFSWRETLFSERGTLIAIAVGAFVLWLKGAV